MVNVENPVGRKTAITLVAVLGGLGSLAAWRILASGGERHHRGRRGPAPVEVAPIERGPIELRRTFTGSLEARRRFVVTSHVRGRVQKLTVDLADPVSQGQVVAELEDADEVQGVNEAAAELAVARANVADAESALTIAARELERLEAMRGRGIASEADLDTARTRHLAKKTAVKVARARLQRARAGLARAHIRSGYTRVIATWSGDDKQRVVAARHVDEGDTVAPGDPVVTVVDLDPVEAVIYVTEREYGRLAAGQDAVVTTDAYPDTEFRGHIRRVAPVFQASSRQARMELEIPNPDGRLKPGMFIRAEVVLERVAEATIVPQAALTRRGGETGVFVVDAAGDSVSWRPVEPGVRQGERVQVSGDGLEGRVVVLGQQLVDDGSPITIPEGAASGPAAASRDAASRGAGEAP